VRTGEGRKSTRDQKRGDLQVQVLKKVAEVEVQERGVSFE